MIIEDDLNLTKEDFVSFFKDETPNWIMDFKREAQKYDYVFNQSSLAGLRSTKLGNCVAYTKLGAWHALKEGYDCKFVRFAIDRNMGHMFLYASKDDRHWAISNKKSAEVYSIENAILRMGGFGSIFHIEKNINYKNLDNNNWERTNMTNW